ncbi:AI-2E family transporter [Magnetococcales bacterium HHB-1]
MSQESTPILEEGFIHFLLIAAIFGLGWLFYPFLPGLFLASLLASSTYAYYESLTERFSLVSDTGAFLMTILVFLLVVAPVIYFLTATGIRVGKNVQELRLWLAGFEDVESLREILRLKMTTLPLPDELKGWLLEEAADKKGVILAKMGKGALFLFKNISHNITTFLSSMVVILFSLFFFYRDGPLLVKRIQSLTPLTGCFKKLLIHRFTTLAEALTWTILIVAAAQGLSFALAAAFMDLPWFYLGTAIAVASFIPVVGSFIVWGPLSLYLYWNQQTGAAIFIAIWGAVVTGFVIDNLLRPYLIQRLASRHATEEDEDMNPLNHTLLTVLATFGGLIGFGIMGLFFGPMIAAMAITVFDAYEMKHKKEEENEERPQIAESILEKLEDPPPNRV